MMYIITLLIIDQVAKWLSKVNLQPSSIYKVINNMLSFTYVENRGAAFGMMTGKQIFLIVVTIVALIYLIYKYYKDVRKSKDKLLKAGFILIISGAIGNLIDRIFLGYVIDFIKLEFIDFPVFNFADIYVSVGCIIISFYILFKHEEE